MREFLRKKQLMSKEVSILLIILIFYFGGFLGGWCLRDLFCQNKNIIKKGATKWEAFVTFIKKSIG